MEVSCTYSLSLHRRFSSVRVRLLASGEMGVTGLGRLCGEGKPITGEALRLALPSISSQRP